MLDGALSCIHGRGCLSPFVSRAGWHTADAGDDRLGSPADKTGSAAWFHCSHFLCRAFSPVTAVVSGIAVVRRSNEADAHGLEASCRHGRVGAPLETDAVAQSRRAGRARRHLTINPAEDRTRRSRGVDRGSYVRDASSRADRPRRRLLRSPQHRCRSAVFDGDTAITGPPMSEYMRVELDWRGRTVLVGARSSISLAGRPQPRSNTLTTILRLGGRSPSIPHCHCRPHG